MHKFLAAAAFALVAFSSPQAHAVNMTVPEAMEAARLYCTAYDAIYGTMSGTGMVDCVTEAYYDALLLKTDLEIPEATKMARIYCIRNMANPDNCVELIDRIRNRQPE